MRSKKIHLDLVQALEDTENKKKLKQGETLIFIFDDGIANVLIEQGKPSVYLNPIGQRIVGSVQQYQHQ